MSVREEENRKTSCPSRGLGLAAAAIGVGVGAALYYFFSKRQEQPDTEGSTSGNWSCEQLQALSPCKSEYTTISEHTTTDTSIWATDDSDHLCIALQNKYRKSKTMSNRQAVESSNESDDEYETVSTDSYNDGDPSSPDSKSDSLELSGFSSVSSMSEDSESDYNSVDSCSSSDEEIEDMGSIYEVTDSDTEYEDSLLGGFIDSESTAINIRNTVWNGWTNTVHVDAASDSDSNLSTEWDVTTSSLDVPTSNSVSPLLEVLLNRFGSFVAHSPRTSTQDEQTRILRERAFRERRWSLEECAICFDVMLKDQPLMQLPCTHNFHVACIGPWLQEHQTCPMCRTAAE